MFTNERELSNSSHFGNQQSGHGWQGLDYEAFPTPSRPNPFPSPTLSDHTVDPKQPAGVTSVPPNADKPWPVRMGQHGLCLKGMVPRQHLEGECDVWLWPQASVSVPACLCVWCDPVRSPHYLEGVIFFHSVAGNPSTRGHFLSSLTSYLTY